MEIQYGCLKCRLVGTGRIYAGSNCPGCGDIMIALPGQPEVKKSSPREIGMKMDYLRELRQVDVKSSEAIDERNERISRVCDSIESDLGIMLEMNDDGPVTINISTINFDDVTKRVADSFRQAVEQLGKICVRS